MHRMANAPSEYCRIQYETKRMFWLELGKFLEVSFGTAFNSHLDHFKELTHRINIKFQNVQAFLWLDEIWSADISRSLFVDHIIRPICSSTNVPISSYN